MKDLKYEITNLHPGDLIPQARLCRVHSDAQVKKIGKSFEKFGFLSPILIDEDKTILAGHGRLRAAQKGSCKPRLVAGRTETGDPIDAHERTDGHT